jgi:hypothetical protein
VLLSVHIADVRARDALALLRAQPRLRSVPGIAFGATMNSVPLRSSKRLPRPNVRRIGLLAGWRDDEPYERFLAENPVAALLADGWSARLAPLRVWGAWPDAGPIPTRDSPDPTGPVAGLTLGRLRLRRALPFLAASAEAERAALEHPGILAATAFTRPPRLVATFSLWRDHTAVRDYATGAVNDGHRRAMAAHQARSFHHDAVFIRLAPYDIRGTWNGQDIVS